MVYQEVSKFDQYHMTQNYLSLSEFEHSSTYTT